MALMEIQTTDQILKQLSEVASKSEDQTFRLKISRKAMNQMIPTVIATLDGCTIEHLANPETWLSQLAGGGDYYLHASHATARSVSFGPLQVRMAGEVNAVDPFADTKPEWRGPREIIVPTKPKQQDPYAGYTSVGVTEPQGASPRNDRPQGSGSVAPAPSTLPAADPLAYERQRLQATLDELNRRERQAAEERHRAEVAIERQKQDLALEKLRAEFAAQPKGESQIDKLLMLMREEAKAQAEKEEARRREDREREDRRAEAERIREEKRLEQERIREEKRIEREREDRREREAERTRLEERLAAERKAANEQFMVLMQKLNDKPAIDPMIQKMLDNKENQATEAMRIMQPMMEMAGQNMNMMVQMIHTVAELQGGGQGESDPPIVKLVGKIVDGIQAAAAAGRGPAVRLPAPPPRPPAPPRVARPPAPSPVSEVPAPAPAAPVKTPPLAGLEQQPAPAPAPAPLKVVPPSAPPAASAMDQIIAMIKSHHDPEQVAHFFFQHATDPSIAKPLAAADMQILAAFAPHLMSWLANSEDNQTYVRNLFAVVNEVAPQYGAALDGMGEEEGEEEEEDEEGEEEGEEEPEDVTPQATKETK